MATNLQLKGSLQITITPMMHYFIQLLTSSRLEFIESLENEVEANPMLEFDASETPGGEPAGETEEKNVYEKRLERADSSFVAAYEEQGFFTRSSSSSETDKNRALEALTPSRVTLSDHLMEQASATFESEQEIEIARHIIYNLDADGYLKVEIESSAALLKTTPEEIERIRAVIKGFDPVGCAAKSLRECLLAQLGDMPDSDKLRQLVDNHLEDLSRSRFDQIAKTMGIDAEAVRILAASLKRLNPKPGQLYEKQDIEYADVDLMLVKENNEYRVYYIEDGLPRLMLSQYYREMLEKARDKKTISYLKQRHRDAQFFIESVELRKKTILRIAEFLVKVQKDYLDFGEKWKRPLTMKEVAREINLNESTISRSVSNKFMVTEKGLLSLKSFFSYGLKGDFGFIHAVETVKEKIREIIGAESRERPLADDDIAAKLAQLGIKIARRTVRNYREEMNIPSSFVRKVRKKEHPNQGEKK